MAQLLNLPFSGRADHIRVDCSLIQAHFSIFRCHSRSFRYIPVPFLSIPFHSGTILVHSVSFRRHSASFRYIPFRSIPFLCLVTPVKMRLDAISLSVKMLHFLHQFFLDLYSVTLFFPTSSIQPLPTKMGRNSVCSWQVSNFCGLDKSGISPALDNALSAFLSCCSQHFFPVCFLYTIFFWWSRLVTMTVNKSQWRQAFTCRLF